METLRDFEERVESLWHRSLAKDAAKFAEDLGVNLHLKYTDPAEGSFHRNVWRRSLKGQYVD